MGTAMNDALLEDDVSSGSGEGSSCPFLMYAPGQTLAEGFSGCTVDEWLV